MSLCLVLNTSKPECCMRHKNDKEVWLSSFNFFSLKLEVAFTRKCNWNKDYVCMIFHERKVYYTTAFSF